MSSRGVWFTPDPRFTRTATFLHGVLLLAGVLSIGAGLWGFVELVQSNLKGR